MAPGGRAQDGGSWTALHMLCWCCNTAARPSQPQDLQGATWEPGSCSSLQDCGQHHHPWGQDGATVRTTLAFTAEKSPCHFLAAIASYHVCICKEGQKLDKSYLIEKNPLRPVPNPGLLLKLLTTGTEKEAELPNLSSPPMQLVEKTWKIYAVAAGEGWKGIYK